MLTGDVIGNYLIVRGEFLGTYVSCSQHEGFSCQKNTQVCGHL